MNMAVRRKRPFFDRAGINYDTEFSEFLGFEHSGINDVERECLNYIYHTQALCYDNEILNSNVLMYKCFSCKNTILVKYNTTNTKDLICCKCKENVTAVTNELLKYHSIFLEHIRLRVAPTLEFSFNK